MKLSPANARKLASLSALGAGALVVGMGEAEASVVYGTLSPSSGKVGFSGGYSVSVSGFTTGGANVFQFLRNYGFPTTGYGGRHSVKFIGENDGFGTAAFKTAGGLLGLFSAHKKFSTAAGGQTGAGTVAWRSWWKKFGFKTTRIIVSYTFRSSAPTTKTRSGVNGHSAPVYSTTTVVTTTVFGHHRSGAPFADKFALFAFNVGSGTEYGWLKLSLDNNVDTYGSSNAYGPDVTLVQWAYDTTGAQLGAGDTGAVPEPGTFAMTGLAALALGAVGVRRWRAARAARTA